MTDSSTLLEVARTVAMEARDLIVAGRSQATVAATKSSSVDIVTQMDIAAEELVRNRLAELRPGDGVLGEEGEATASSTGITWVVDPIDGTVNYLYGIPHYAVSVAAVSGHPVPEQWTVEAGAVADGSGGLWSALKDGGAWHDGEPLVAGPGPDLAHTLVATGFQYESHLRARQGAVVAQLLPRVRDIRRLGSAAIDLCHAAAGRVDAYYEQGLKPWDFAAGLLIAQEAGLTVASLHRGVATGGMLIAAGPAVWDSLHDALLEAGAEAF